jgi:uncharacterized protein YicC (UPF0701 family)
VAPESPEQQLRGHLRRADLDAKAAVARVGAMASEQDPSKWDEAKATATKAITAAEKALTRARGHEGAAPDVATQIADVATAIEDAKQRLATIGPMRLIGWRWRTSYSRSIFGRWQGTAAS